ncbi:hypothetical protein [Pedobacter chitinilyticus]|uniref:Uncharacterized protein n=1 Tax=Pedobacter chitinilyticus TaxID=2233776 RepID=A0A3S3SUW2_9SPHI|nr:hypothetical protein [Pedobacter chitinilyticus]RWU08159.1 hypothetical protein DPV69_07195 [Pedobacter chitinilyticus]
MKKFSAPISRKDFTIVVHRGKPALLAVALSYLYRSGEYLPVFLCSGVEVAQDSEVLKPDVYAIQRRRAEEFAVFLNNALIENDGCENLVFLGLSDNQKSFLESLRPHYNILDIDGHDDIEPYLDGFAVDKGGVFEFRSEEVCEALFYAARHNLKLRRTVLGQVVPPADATRDRGLIVVERTGSGEEIIGVGYALSIGADLLLVDGLQKRENDEVLHLLESWQAGDLGALGQLREKINMRIGAVDFEGYPFATFFTDGLPYPLCVTQIPTSMVNHIYRPDFFVFNAIISEYDQGCGSAAVFSPGFFAPDEEVHAFIPLFEHHNFYLRKLLGKGASLFNLRNTIELYPFDILHICSHGGAVKGHYCKVSFSDANGTRHSVEFDHVLSIGITPYLDQHLVESLYYFRKLNGLRWRSAELDAMDYPNELYASLEGVISKAFTDKKVKYLADLDRVQNSNAISCEYSHYNANFSQFVGSRRRPVIFNNACWSWGVISNQFLVAGARGYIGSLREIPNLQAVGFAKNFYGKLFDGTILGAFHHANGIFLQENAEPLYIYWGLHFSTIRNENAVLENRHRIHERLKESLNIWVEKFLRNEGSADLLKAKVLDTRWLIRNDMNGDGNGHTLLN